MRTTLLQAASHILLLVAALGLSNSAYAQELVQEEQGVWRAEVVEVRDTKTVVYPPGDVETIVQNIVVRILEGERAGQYVRFDNDYILLEAGDTFYMNYLVTMDGDEIFSVREMDRRLGMLMVGLLFIATIIGFGGLQGVRSLLSLAGSLVVIAYVLVPSLVQGYPPVPTSTVVASLVLFCAIFFTHGFNRRSAIAYGVTLLAVLLTGILAYFSVSITHLTGFASDETVYLNLNTGGQLDFVGLLLAAIIIGVLGVLDDIAVTQVAVVRELFSSNRALSKREVYARALRVGREHVGALVNTLVLAYTGAALPLLLLFSFSDGGVVSLINREIFATEIIRSLVGSIGLVLTVPITTLLAVVFLGHTTADASSGKNQGSVQGHQHRHEV